MPKRGQSLLQLIIRLRTSKTMRVLISNYNNLSNDYGDLESAFTTPRKEKNDLEKTEHEKNQQFRQQLHMKLHGLH
jgi:hypothetical protein